MNHSIYHTQLARTRALDQFYIYICVCMTSCMYMCAHIRSYYRCTHRADQGCRATRQVQASDANPSSEFIISYFGQHTCRDPSTIPLLVIPDDTAPPPPDCANLISFGGSTVVVVGGASPSANTTTTVPTTMLSRFGYSSSLPTQTQAQAQLAAAVVGPPGTTMTASWATVGSAPAE